MNIDVPWKLELAIFQKRFFDFDKAGKKLIQIIEDLYEDECYDLDFLCFLAVLTDTEYEQLEEIFEEVEFYA